MTRSAENIRMSITRATLVTVGASLGLALLSACQQPPAAASNPPEAEPNAAAEHVTGQPGLDWGPAPPVLPPGAEFAVLQGDPASNAPFTIRLRLPSGYRIPPHTHPTDEHVTVLTGRFLVGMGVTFETDGLSALDPGGFVTAGANEAHYATAVGSTVIQVHAIGPFALTYVNPADAPGTDPSRQPKEDA